MRRSTTFSGTSGRRWGDPLFALLIFEYLVVPILWIVGAVHLSKRFQPGSIARKIIIVGAALGLYPLVMWDDMLGHWKWRSLCSSEAKFVVHRVVEVPAAYFDEDGLVKTDAVTRRVQSPGSSYEQRSGYQENYSPSPARVGRYYVTFVDTAKGEALG